MIVLEFIVTFFCAYLGSVIGRTISIHTGNYPPDNEPYKFSNLYPEMLLIITILLMVVL